MRRGTAITLIVLFVLLVITAVVQLNQEAPPAPFPGPVSGTPFPTQFSPSPAA
jgi:hypothetical protein